MADQPKDIYAPIPARAMADEELTAEHFRVLMAVAAHDRFNKNGKGCCASHPRLAAAPLARATCAMAARRALRTDCLSIVSRSVGSTIPLLTPTTTMTMRISIAVKPALTFLFRSTLPRESGWVAIGLRLLTP